MDKKGFIKIGYNKMKGNKLAMWLLAAMCGLCACNDDSQLDTDKTVAMQVSVQAENQKVSSRGVIDGGLLPDGSTIGVSLTAADGSIYDGIDYYNLPYTAADNAGVQTWSCGADKVPSLSLTIGKAIAYYPYNGAENLDLTAVPVETTSQTDYMYAKPVEGLTLYAPQANFSMKHALTNIRLMLVNESFTGNTELSYVKITSPFFGTAAKWNVTTGVITDVTGTGADLVPVLAEGTVLSDEPLQLDVITIADESVTSGNLQIILEVGPNQFKANFPITEAFLNGNAYQYTLKLNNSGVTIEGANVVDWVEEDIEQE